MASVIFRNIRKTYNGRVRVLDGINVEIKDREFAVIVGPSGCGKTTLLRMLAGLEGITSGEIFIGDIQVNELPPSKREIAMVFQDYALYPHMTVEENMSFALKLRNFPAEEIKKRVNEAAGILQISQYLDRMPRELSGGQRQRVAIGRAIVRKPKVFLFDEPLSNLDAKLREEMRVEIAKLHQRLDSTIIYVTHDQVEAMTLATQIIILNKGTVQQIGSPMDVYRKPKNRFVAGFIGSPAMNFIKGTITSEDGAAFFSSGYFRIKIPRPAFNPNFAEKEVILGIRPQDILIEEKRRPDETIETVLEVRELLGHKENLYLKAGKQTMLACTEKLTGARPGSTLPVSFNYDNIHFFDAKTETRLN